MSANFVIVPGMPISGLTRKGVCQVGAIAFDIAGACYGLSARHVLECESSPAVFDPGTGREIGVRVSDGVKWSNGQPFHCSIGRFLIEPSTQVRMATPFRSVLGVANPFDLVGSQVFWLDDYYGSAPGEVVGVGGAIRFVDPYTDRATVMKNVIEIKVGFNNFRVRGEAGALLVDEGDLAVGLLISRQGETCFLAPLSSYLQANDLFLADDRTSKIYGVDTDLAGFAGELMQIELGASKMKDDLVAELGDRAHDDQAVPESLRFLMEAAG
jgi:hypothetical protein